MKKKLSAFILSAALVLSLPAAVSAAETAPAAPETAKAIIGAGDEMIGVNSVANSVIGASRHSATSGSVEAYAAFHAKTSKATCTIYLQEKYNGSWRSARGIPKTSYSKTVYDSYSITVGKNFTLASGKVYRAKIVFTDTLNGTTYTKTRYTGSF